MKLTKISSNANVILNYLKSDLIKKQRSFKIGLISIFLVVFFITLLTNTIANTQVIFLRLSENQVGETDIIMLPMLNKQDISKKKNVFDSTKTKEKNRNAFDQLSNFQLLNFTDLQVKLKDEPYFEGIVPRWIFQANSSSAQKSEDINWAVSNMIIIDSELENEYGFGRKLHLKKLNYSECYITDSLYKHLKLNLTENKDKITLQIKLMTLLKVLGGLDELFKVETSSPPQNRKISVTKNSDNLNLFNTLQYIDKNQKLDKTNNTANESKKNETRYFAKLFSNFKFLDDVSLKLNSTQLLKTLDETGLIDNAIIFEAFLNSEISDYLPFSRNIKKFFNSTRNNNEDENFEIFNIRKQILETLFSFENNTIRLKSETNSTSEEKIIKVNMTRMLLSLPDDELEKIFTLEINLKVIEVVDTKSGKWPSVLGNVIAIDSNFGNRYLGDVAINTFKSIAHYLLNSTIADTIIEYTVRDYLKDFNLNTYALTVNMIIKDKFSYYSKDNTDLRQSLSKLTSKIINKLGYDYPLQMQLPLYQSNQAMQIAKIFLQNIFSSVTFFLWVLSILLIYSLMLGNVDERNYEFGMLRALGFKKENLIWMIIMQALVFSLPAIILALFSCYILNTLLSYLMFLYSGLKTSFYLYPTSIIWGVFSGLLIPLISSYFPIKKALSENLKEALTIFNKKIGDISVSIVKLEKMGVSPASFVASLILIIIGFSTYYLAPLSFFLMNYSLFLLIMNLILITMIIGLIFMMQLLVPKLQIWVLNFIMIFTYKDRNIKFVVEKNLVGHSRRNQKTSIMFMISLSFIIFAGCTLRLIAGFIVSASKNFFGANIWVFQNSPHDSLDQNKLNEYLNKFNKNFPNSLKNYSYISYPLQNIIQQQTRFSPLCGYPEKNTDIVSVDTGLIDSGFTELYMFSEYNKNLNFSYNRDTGKVDLISGLYRNKLPPILDRNNKSIIYPVAPSYIKGNETYMDDLLIIVPEGHRIKYSTDLENNANIEVGSQNFPSRIIGLAIKIPGIPSYSSYSTIANFAPILISNEQMKEIIDYKMSKDDSVYDQLTSQPAYLNTPDNIRKKYLLIKLNDDVPRKIRETLYFGIKNFVNNENTQTVFVDELIDDAQDASDILEYFFIVIGLIALILAFFLIWTSFYCNIKDNICEYGILRAIGINKSQSMRVYLYEASALLISSIIVGTFIGVFISITLVLQFNLFSELPFNMNFPFKLYLIMCFSGFGLGLLGSYYPTHQVNRLSLVKIIKGIFD